MAGQQWTGVIGAWPRAFFRLAFPVAGTPSSATLWLDANQAATVNVDGQRLTGPNGAKAIRIADVNPARTQQVVGYDILPALSVGTNAIGLDLVSYQGGSPAFRGKVVVTYGAHRLEFGATPAAWRSTTDVSLTGQAVPGAGGFSSPTFATVGWQTAVPAAARPTGLGLTLPSGGWEDPRAGLALAGSGHSLVAATLINVPAGCVSGYVRIASVGNWQLDVDGHALAAGPGGYTAFGDPGAKSDQPTEIRTVPTQIVDVCSAVGAGEHVLRVRVQAAGAPTVYIDGAMSTTTATTRFDSGQGWQAVSAENTDGAPLHVVPLQDVGPKGRLVLVGGAAVPAHHGAHHLRLSVGLAAAAGALVLAITAIRRRRRPVRRTTVLRSVALGLLPATALVVVASQLRHLTDVTPPFPSTPGMLDAVGLTALGGLGVALGSAPAQRRWNAWRRPATLRSSAGLSRFVDMWRANRTRSWIARHPYQCAVTAFAAVWAVVTDYRITFQPVWQDELSSLAAAQGIRTHGIPAWPSGFEYWKSELYSASIAIIGVFTHDSLAVLRSVSLLWLLATILLFGLVLVPLVLPGRRWTGLAATVVFATSPFELAHARDLRMYQMEQFFVLLVAIVLLRAIVVPTTRRVAIAALAIVGMYLTHEETFGVLVTVPVVLCGLVGLRWARNWRWWVFGGAAVAVVGVQLGLATFTRPAGFGVDQSNGPFVRWSPSPFYYLDRVFFVHQAHAATLTWVTLLALVAVIVGVKRRHSVRLYLAAFWILPVTVVALILPATQTRYGFIVYPFEFALAACGARDITGWVRRILVPGAAAPATRVLIGLTSIGLTVAVMASMLTAVSDYGPAVAAVTGTAYSQGQSDFGLTGGYVRTHLQSGDIVIAGASANVVAYGDGRTPNYWMPNNPAGKLLYLFEKDGRAVDTQYGIPTILSGGDLERVIDGHHRTWLVTADDLVASLPPSELALLRSRFRLTSEAESTSVFLSTS